MNAFFSKHIPTHGIAKLLSPEGLFWAFNLAGIGLNPTKICAYFIFAPLNSTQLHWLKINKNNFKSLRKYKIHHVELQNMVMKLKPNCGKIVWYNKIELIKFHFSSQPPNLKPNPQRQGPFDHTPPSANCLSCLTLSLLPFQGCHTKTGMCPRAKLSHTVTLPHSPQPTSSLSFQQRVQYVSVNVHYLK